MSKEQAFHDFVQQNYIDRVSVEEAFNAGFDASTFDEISYIDVNAELPELKNPYNDGGWHSDNVLALRSDGQSLTMYLFSGGPNPTPCWCFEWEFVTYTVDDVVAWRPL